MIVIRGALIKQCFTLNDIAIKSIVFYIVLKITTERDKLNNNSHYLYE